MPETQPNPGARELDAALEQGASDLKALLERAHPADIAEWLQEVGDEQLAAVMSGLPVGRRAEVLEHAYEGLRERAVGILGVPLLVEVVEELAPDDAVDLLGLVEVGVADAVLAEVDLETAKQLRDLARYADDSAGGIMTSDYDAFSAETHVGDVIKALRKDEEAGEHEGAGVYVLDERERPIGFVSDRELLVTPIHSPLSEVMETEIVSVPADLDQEEVAQILSKYDLSSVPVLGRGGSMIGIVTADDAHEAHVLEAQEDFHKLVGTTAQQQTRLPVLRRVRQRMPLMGLTVLGGLLTARILGFALGNAEGVAGTADVLRYIPIVIGLAGNVGIQSSTILVRGLATGEVAPEREVSVLYREVATGATIGLVCGWVTALVAAWLEATDTMAVAFGMAVGGAIAIAVAWAAFLGCLVPIVCRRVGIDPAIVAGPFLITLSDVSGTAIFVGVAHLVLSSGGAG